MLCSKQSESRNKQMEKEEKNLPYNQACFDVKAETELKEFFSNELRYVLMWTWLHEYY